MPPRTWTERGRQHQRAPASSRTQTGHAHQRHHTRGRSAAAIIAHTNKAQPSAPPRTWMERGRHHRALEQGASTSATTHADRVRPPSVARTPHSMSVVARPGEENGPRHSRPRRRGDRRTRRGVMRSSGCHEAAREWCSRDTGLVGDLRGPLLSPPTPPCISIALLRTHCAWELFLQNFPTSTASPEGFARPAHESHDDQHS